MINGYEEIEILSSKTRNRKQPWLPQPERDKTGRRQDCQRKACVPRCAAAQAGADVLAHGTADPLADLSALPPSRQIDCLDLPGGLCLYERVLVPVGIDGRMPSSWLCVGGTRREGEFKELPDGFWR